MKYFIFLGLVLISSLACAQFNGAWKLIEQNGKPLQGEIMINIISEGYFMFSNYTSDGKFKSAGGGTYSIIEKEDAFTQKLDFFTIDTAQVGKQVIYNYKLKGKMLTIETNMHSGILKETWELIDNTNSELKGAWRFGVRLDDNDKETDKRRGPGPRQTIKILSGKYFQWAAFNTATKQFSGTGGGEYTLENGQYTEKINFFSRDDSRVGKELSFACRVQNSDWFHKGKSSTGGNVNEVWERID
jgi:hypothetical protein